MPAFEKQYYAKGKKGKRKERSSEQQQAAVGLSLELCGFCFSCVTIPKLFQCKIDFFHMELKMVLIARLFM